MIFTTAGKKELTKEHILKQITEESLWTFYTGLEVKFNQMFLSPIRKESNPSACFYYTKQNQLRLIDFGESIVMGRRKTYDIWSFLMQKYHISFRECLQKVNSDINNTTKPIEYLGEPVKRIRESKKIITFPKGFNKEELEYWNQYYIDKDLLTLGRVESLDHYWIVSESYSVKFKQPFSFAYKCSNEEYQIYKPLEEKGKKFYTNLKEDTLFGEHLLPWLGDLLIITKSYKDALVLNKLKYNSIGFRSENTFPSKLKIDTLKHRFKNIVTLFDPDKAGRNGAEQLFSMYNFKYFFLNEHKDISDYIKNEKIDKTEKMLWHKLEILLK